MIKLNKKLSSMFDKDVFYFTNIENLYVVESFAKESNCEEGTCELLLTKYNGSYYLFGAAANSNYLGFAVDKDDFMSSENKYYYFDRYFL